MSRSGSGSAHTNRRTFLKYLSAGVVISALGDGLLILEPVYADDAKKDTVKRLALLFGAGFAKDDENPKLPPPDIGKVGYPNEFRMMIRNAETIGADLVDVWKFPGTSVDGHIFTNSIATKSNLKRELQGITDVISTLDANITECYVKVHLQGHHEYGDPTKVTKKESLIAQPPKEGDNSAHDALRCFDSSADGTTAGWQKIENKNDGLLFDYELAAWAKGISDLIATAKKRQGSKLKTAQLIVQLDSCFSETMMAKLKNLPDVSTAWSAGSNCIIDVGGAAGGHGANLLSLWTSGFNDAFGEGASKPPTVEEAHASAEKKANSDADGNKPQGAGHHGGAGINPAGSAPK